jgi:hypothetical protein
MPQGLWEIGQVTWTPKFFLPQESSFILLLFFYLSNNVKGIFIFIILFILSINITFLLYKYLDTVKGNVQTFSFICILLEGKKRFLYPLIGWIDLDIGSPNKPIFLLSSNNELSLPLASIAWPGGASRGLGTAPSPPIHLVLLQPHAPDSDSNGLYWCEIGVGVKFICMYIKET